jgi:hypothetical protein
MRRFGLGFVLLLAACGGSDPATELVDRSQSATPPYAGPLDAGAAVSALECDGTTPYDQGEAYYDDGLATVQTSAAAALSDYMRESGLVVIAPADGYAVERERAGRVLLSYDVGGRTKVAMVAADDVRDWNDDEGWGVREYALCDPSEFPHGVTEALEIGVWEDESGRRVPITRIHSLKGSEHCETTEITFILLGPKMAPDTDWYVSDTRGHADYSGLLRTTFSDDASLPEGATDTGWRRGGRQLWIGPENEAAYLVSIDDADDIERWPAAKQPLWCI